MTRDAKVAAARREGGIEGALQERDAIVKLIRAKRAKFNAGTRTALALGHVLEQIEARTGGSR